MTPRHPILLTFAAVLTAAALFGFPAFLLTGWFHG